MNGLIWDKESVLQISHLEADTSVMTSKESQKEKKSMLLALLLLVGAGVMGLVYFSSGEKSSYNREPGSLVKSEKFEKSVNKHLMLTNEKMAFERQRMQLENAQILNKDFNATAGQQSYQNENKLDTSSDTRATDIANELGRGERREESLSPHDIVQKDLFNEQQIQEYSQAYKEEYARQFVENAKRGGYRVILSEDLKHVLSVTPLRQPSQNNGNVFGSGSDVLQ